MLQEFRHAVRSLGNAPAFTAAVIVTLALGISASAAIFGIADAVLLKTVPVANSHELYFLAHGTGERPSLSSTYPLFARYRSLSDVFSGVTAYLVRELKVETNTGVAAVPGQYVADNYHRVLGVPLILGHGFSEENGREPTSFNTVISEGYWTRTFGRDTNVIGRTLTVDGQAVTIVGVTAAGFHGLRPGTQFEITLPLSMRAADDPGFFDRHDTWTGLNIVARLRPGISEAQAIGRVQAVFQEYMSTPEQAWTRGDVKTHESFRVARLLPAGRGTSGLRAQYDGALRVLLAMVGLIFLIACANVAHLTIVRYSGRRREIAIRKSIGATRARLVRQFMTESLLLASSGGAIGLLCSVWIAAAIVSLFRGGQLPVLISIDLDRRLLAFTIVISLVTAGLVGLLPALRASAQDPAPALKAGGFDSTNRRFGAGAVLTIGQVAVALLLLAASAALVRSLASLRSVDSGFDSENVLLFYLTPGARHDSRVIHPALTERLKSLPGARAVSFSTASPLATDEESRPITIPGGTAADKPFALFTNRVSPEYFSVFGIPLFRGREFTTQDSAGAPMVAIISETMARTRFSGSDPIGRTFLFASMPHQPVTVVGVARDVRHQTLRRAIPALVYVPLAQAAEPPQLLTGAIRTANIPRGLEHEVRTVLASYDRDLLVSYVRTMEQQIATSLVRERIMAWLSGGFSVIALVLACVGLYGVMTNNVTRRTREIGIRIALGAAPSAILRQTLRDALLLCSIGLVLGLVSAAITTPAIGAFMFGFSPRAPTTLIISTVVLLSTALLAAYVPARRAARIDPMGALRTE